MRIALIGAGNLATHLGVALIEKNHQVVQIFSRTAESAALLSSKLGCPFTTELFDIVTDADVYILAVKDYAIEAIVENLDFKDHLVVHTSGSVPISIFKSHCRNYGVFYPLQSFSKDNKVEFRTIPILIEASTLENQTILENLASDISDKVMPVNSSDRLIMHLSAVFANNFVNHFYHIAEQLLKDRNIDFNLLKPLILETAAKAVNSSPEKVQTGPAIRKEKRIMDEHLKILSSYPEWERIYQLISENIYNTYKDQNDVF